MTIEPEAATMHLSECPLCKSDRSTVVHENIPDFKYRVPGTWTFVRCGNCGLLYLNPRPADLNKGYPQNYTQHTMPAPPRIEGTGSFSFLVAAIRGGCLHAYGYPGLTARLPVKMLGKLCVLIPAVRLRAFYAFILFPRARAGGKLLDIGCGSGRFLSVMRMLGWDVFGIEPDQFSSQVAKKLSGASLFTSLEKAGFPGSFFDIITSNHSLEHVADPLPMMKECHRILKPGGSIGLCAPNSKSLSHRLFGKYCYHLEPPRHLVMWQPASLKTLLSAAGFTVDSVTTTSLRERRDSFTKSWGFKTGARPPALLQMAWRVLSAVTGLLDNESGEEVVVWGTKN